MFRLFSSFFQRLTASLRRLMASFRRFMLGRRGMDTLGFVLVFCAFLLDFVSVFFQRNAIVYFSLQILFLSFVGFFFCRFFSRNLAKREAENRKVSRFLRDVKNRFRDRKTHVYFKCPACKNTLRVPRGRGQITATCPVCHEQVKRRT